MARFSDVITLVSEDIGVNDEGIPTQQTFTRNVFFNRYSIGFGSRLAAAADGMHGMAYGAVRSADYHGERIAVIGGAQMTVTSSENRGDVTVLTFQERTGNGTSL